MKNKLFTAIATLTGTVIGAGFLGIPYVIARSGFLIGLAWMCLISIIMMLVNLMVAEIGLSTKQIHQLPGYASKYLGRRTKIFIFFASIFGLYAALIAYLLGEGESLSFIFTGNTNYALLAGLIFWLIVAIISFKGIRSFKKIEPLAVIAVFLVTLILGIINFDKIDISNLSYSNTSYLFLPFGVVLFAFLGISSIPEMRRVLLKHEKLMKKAIIIGSFIPLIVYVLFTIIVLGLYGSSVNEIATISLGKVVTLLGIFTMFTAFLALSLALQDTYRFDFGLGLRKAWMFSIFVPLIFFLIIKIFNIADFVKILSLGGAISGGLLSIAILLIHEHLKDERLERKPEFQIRLPVILKILFIILFLVGILYEFL
jgi:tyrosine-specific transport protein